MGGRGRIILFLGLWAVLSYLLFFFLWTHWQVHGGRPMGTYWPIGAGFAVLKSFVFQAVDLCGEFNGRPYCWNGQGGGWIAIKFASSSVLLSFLFTILVYIRLFGSQIRKERAQDNARKIVRRGR